MPPLLMVAAGRLLTLDEPALVLGVDREYSYETSRIDLPERFRLICHTDGLTEAASGAGEALGEQHLHEALLATDAFQTVKDVADRIANTWTTHLSGSQADDDALALIIGRS